MTSAASDTEPMIARTPEDVLAAVPVVLGFVPEESVVMLTLGSVHPFHARIDLPLTVGDRRGCADTLLRPALRHGVTAVVFVLYATDPAPARACARVLAAAFVRHGVEVVRVLRTDGRWWFELPPGGLPERPGQEYDRSGHLFTVQAVASGKALWQSRGELAASVAPDHEAVSAVAAAARDRAGWVPSEAVAWARSTIERLVVEHTRPDATTTAGLLLALREGTVRDSLLRGLDRSRAEGLLPLLSALTRAAPSHLVGPAASVLAFAAWLAGDGALAWCALDRAAEGDPACSLADLVARALERALPPSVWGLS